MQSVLEGLMLTLKNVQIEYLQRLDWQRVERELTSRTAAYWPEWFADTASAQAAGAAVHQMLSFLRAKGVDAEFDLARFVQAAFMLHDLSLQEAGWVLEHLEAMPSIGPRAAMNRIVNEARVRVHTQALHA